MTQHNGIKDCGACFVINPISRKVIVPPAHNAIGTVGDHNSEQITFEIPQTIDGHAVAQCTRKYISWMNVQGEVGHDELTVAEGEPSAEGMIYLTWTIRDALTVEKGLVQFSIHLECVGENKAILYRWSTTTCRDCEILDAINETLGKYDAIYVNGETLVIADYNPVADSKLTLDSYGIIPTGAIELNENKRYNVGLYGEAIVNVTGTPYNMEFQVQNDTNHYLSVVCYYFDFEKNEFVQEHRSVKYGETGTFTIALGTMFYCHSQSIDSGLPLEKIQIESNNLQGQIHNENGTLLGVLKLLPNANMHTVVVWPEV